MLPGSAHIHQQYKSEEAFITILLTQSRYTEAYELLQMEPQNEPSTQYNIALCHYWAGNYQQALICLDNAQSVLPVKGQAINRTDQFYKGIRERQNQLNDHLQPLTKKYIDSFDILTRDAVIRLKTDCWLRLGDFLMVIKIAEPIACKNYKNITDALKSAKNTLENE